MKKTIEPVRLSDVLAIAGSARSAPQVFRYKKPLVDHRNSKPTKGRKHIVKKQTFARVDLGRNHPMLRFVSGLDIDPEILAVMLQDFDKRVVSDSDPYQKEEDIDRFEDASRKAKVSSGIGSDAVDEDDRSLDGEATTKRTRARTRWPLNFTNSTSEQSESKIEPRYPVPDPKPNRFLTDDMKARRQLVHRKWLELNRTHNWPSWLVCDDDLFFTAEILCWLYPNILTSPREQNEAASTLEALNVFLRGHQPSEDSPLYKMKGKSVAKRVQRFLKEAEDWWRLESLYQDYQREFDLLEGSVLYGRSCEDELVDLWRARLDDED